INKNNQNFYIGSSINLSKRLNQYLNKEFLLKNGNSKIYKALLKYEYKNFKLEILEYCDKDLLISREQYFLNELLSTYNILKITGNSLGYKHILEAIKKIKLAKKGKFTGIKNSFYGKKHITKTKNLFRQYALSRGKPGNAMSVILKDIKNNTENTYLSMSDLAKFLKADRATLAKYRNNSQLFRGQYFIIKTINNI
ncbi:intron endonuclease, partial [Coemansia reversa NRRL 1564]